MYKDLLRTPLQQTLLVLWVAGLLHPVIWLASGRPLADLGGAALLGMVLSVLVAGRLRRPVLLPIALILGLAMTLSFAHQLVGIAPAGAVDLTVLYSLIVWLLVMRALRARLTDDLIRLLDLRGGYGKPGGRRAVEDVIHWNGVAFTLLALCGFAFWRALATGAIPVAPWPALIAGAIFLWLAGRRYERLPHSYLVIALAMWGVLGGYTGLIAGSDVIALHDPALGVLLATGGLASWVIGWWIGASNQPAVVETSSPPDLYRDPLAVAAVVLAGLAVSQVGALRLSGALTAPGGWSLLATSLAALVLLLPNRTLTQTSIKLSGAVLAALSVLWGYSAAVHGGLPDGLWPGYPVSPDLCLVIALLALVFAGLGQVAAVHPEGETEYSRPFFHTAAGLWLWALAGALTLFAEPWTLYPSGVLAVSIAALFPLLRPVEHGVAWRGIGVALLLSLLAFGLLGPDPLRGGSPILIAWAYVLWFTGNLPLPRFNARFPDWAVAPDFWPWLGLLTLGLAVALEPTSITRWSVVLALAGYGFLLLRNSAWPGWAWLAVAGLTTAGLLWSGERHGGGLLNLNTLAVLAVENLLWANVLLLGVALWRRHGDALAAWLGWRQAALAPPLLTAAYGIGGVWLILLMGFNAGNLWLPTGTVTAALIGGLLALTLGHGLYRWRSALAAHLVIIAVLNTLLAMWGIAQPFHLPLLFALCGLSLAAIASLMTTPIIGEAWGRLVVRGLVPWVTALPIATLATGLAWPGIGVGERLLTGAIWAVNAAWLGCWQRRRVWLLGAASMAIALLHGPWLLGVPLDQAPLALPWTALQLAVIAWGLVVLSERFPPRETPVSAMVRDVLISITPWVTGLAVGELLSHGLAFAVVLADSQATAAPMGFWDHAAALLTSVLLIALGVRVARRSQRDLWVYGVAALIGLTGVYARLLWVGLAPLGVGDTAALMAAAYAVFILQWLMRSRPLLNLTLVLPLLAVVTVPMQLGSGHASLTLLAAAALYGLSRRASGLDVPLYLGLLALNGGVYLWVPGWAGQTGLFQVYLFPAALSVLLLLHLHRRELKPSVLNSGRLAALSTLYGVATLDVFLRPEFGIFVLALVLSLAGVVIGIGLRTRAFLYAGVTFLVLNVLGQLIKLYPEQRLGRALVLMALGAFVTGAMIVFTAKREEILQRIRVFRADLEQWD